MIKETERKPETEKRVRELHRVVGVYAEAFRRLWEIEKELEDELRVRYGKFFFGMGILFYIAYWLGRSIEINWLEKIGISGGIGFSLYFILLCCSHVYYNHLLKIHRWRIEDQVVNWCLLGFCSKDAYALREIIKKNGFMPDYSSDKYWIWANNAINSVMERDAPFQIIINDI